MLELLSKYKTQIKYGLYAVLSLVIIYGMIRICTPKPQMPANLKATIDSLTKANEALEAKQLAIDSTIDRYENEIEITNGMIGGITDKTTIIREFYHEQSNTVGKYTPTQVDSFFKSRYKY
jgi:hypothetical protein